MTRKFKIKISTASGGKPFTKQLPELLPQWGNCEFYINEDIQECDLWVVYGGLEKEEHVVVPADMTLFISTEPSTVHNYNKKFLKQFHAIMTCEGSIKHPNIIYNQQALPWWIGYKMNSGEDRYYQTYDELKTTILPPKTKLASIVVSNKTFTSGHKKRYEFLQQLKERLGNTIDIFGVGGNSIDDKWEAIAPYKYHIVLENSSFNDYFTEKLTDAFLGEAYPIYYGCKNIYKYFPKTALSQIDIYDTEYAINQIQKILKSTLYESAIQDIKKSKTLILDKYQIFPMLHEYVNTHTINLNKTTRTIKPEKVNLFSKLLNKFIKIIHG